MIRALALLCLGLLVTMGPLAAADPTLRVEGTPCKGHDDCWCPSDPQNYVFNVPGYVAECTQGS